MAYESRAEEIIARWKGLKGERSLYENHWEDLARVMLPSRTGFVATPPAGGQRSEDIFDGTAMQAARGLANATGGFLRPEGQKFFFIKTVDDRIGEADDAKKWCSAVEDAMLEAMFNPKARFRQATGEVDQDLSVFGTGVIFTGERYDSAHRSIGLLYQSVHLKDAVPFFSEEGDPQGIFREKSYTVRQAATRFGADKLSEETRKKLERKKYDDKVQFLHAVLPRVEGRADALYSKNYLFASIWLEVKGCHEVSVSGFQEFPFAVPRWDTSSGDDYGSSPGMLALPDANTLQAMGETILIAGQRAADPPLLAPNDGFFDEANTFPGGMTYYDADLAKTMGRIPISPLETGGKLPISRDMQQDTRQQIFAAFFRNVLNLPIEGPQMTATEVMQRKEEFIREIGPVFGRLESDYTGPIVERTFNIMLRAGALPPIPQVLAGRSIRFEYQSPVKRVRQQVEAAAAQMWVMDKITIAKETQDPSILDNVDWDEYSRFTAEAASLPPKIVIGKDQVEARRRARAQAQAQAAKQAQTAQTVDTMARAADIPGVRQVVEGGRA